VAQAALAGIVLLWLSAIVLPPDPETFDPLRELVRTVAVHGAVVALVVRYAHRLDPDGARSLGFRAGGSGRAALAGLCAYALCTPVLLGTTLLWPWVVEALGEPFEPQVLLTHFADVGPVALPLAFLLTAVVQPLLEEILFRGFLQPLLVQNLNDWAGIALTSVLFALLHGTSAFLPIFSLSLVLGGLMLRTRRIAAPWLVHGLHNGIVLALTLAAPDAG
jgi:CAAX protease family protein